MVRARPGRSPGPGPSPRPRPALALALALLLTHATLTHGRLLTGFAGHMSFSDLRYLIADEADTLFDDGFGPELRKLVLSVKVWAHDERPWRL